MPRHPTSGEEEDMLPIAFSVNIELANVATAVVSPVVTPLSATFADEDTAVVPHARSQLSALARERAKATDVILCLRDGMTDLTATLKNWADFLNQPEPNQTKRAFLQERYAQVKPVLSAIANALDRSHVMAEDAAKALEEFQDFAKDSQVSSLLIDRLARFANCARAALSASETATDTLDRVVRLGNALILNVERDAKLQKTALEDLHASGAYKMVSRSALAGRMLSIPAAVGGIGTAIATAASKLTLQTGFAAVDAVGPTVGMGVAIGSEMWRWHMQNRLGDPEMCFEPFWRRLGHPHPAYAAFAAKNSEELLRALMKLHSGFGQVRDWWSNILSTTSEATARCEEAGNALRQSDVWKLQAQKELALTSVELQSIRGGLQAFQERVTDARHALKHVPHLILNIFGSSSDV